MYLVIAGITLGLVAISTTLGGLGTGILFLLTIGWLLLALRPVEMGAMVAELTRRRFA